MDIKTLNDELSLSAQIPVADLEAIAAQGRLPPVYWKGMLLGKEGLVEPESQVATEQ